MLYRIWPPCLQSRHSLFERCTIKVSPSIRKVSLFQNHSESLNVYRTGSTCDPQSPGCWRLSVMERVLCLNFSETSVLNCLSSRVLSSSRRDEVTTRSSGFVCVCDQPLWQTPWQQKMTKCGGLCVYTNEKSHRDNTSWLNVMDCLCMGTNGGTKTDKMWWINKRM